VVGLIQLGPAGFCIVGLDKWEVHTVNVSQDTALKIEDSAMSGTLTRAE
jgi:hypothetical protein